MKATTLGQHVFRTIAIASSLTLTVLGHDARAQSVCGNGLVEGGETCDPPGSISCPPGSPGGAFLPCNADCTCGSAGGAILDHFRCYGTRQPSKTKFASRSVNLTDQFGSATVTVRKPLRFCNPVDKNGGGVNDPTAHLLCYKLDKSPFTQREVLVRNQFGDQTLKVKSAESLCVPAEKNGVTSELAVDHFECYRARGKGFAVRDATLADQFETAPVRVVKPRLLCNPVDKNGEGIESPEAHLTCYATRRSTPFTKQEITADDQFSESDGTPLRLAVRKSSFLCVPSEKNPPATTTTTAPPTSTSTTSTTSTTAPLCGNGTTDPGEQCDPPGSLTCPPTSPGGAFTECAADCSCPAVPTTTSTSTTSSTTMMSLCGNKVPDPGEQCDPPGSLTCPPTSPGGAFTECNADCSCPGVPTTTSTSTTSSTTIGPPLCGNDMPDPGEQCDPPGSLTCPPTSPGGAFTECAADCSCPGVPTTTSTSSTSSTIEPVPTTTSTIEGSTTTIESTTTSIVTTTTTSSTIASCCGPERIILTSTEGTLQVDNLPPFVFPAGVLTTLDTSAASGGAECAHDVVVPGGGFFVPNFDIPALNYCSSVTPNGCESGAGDGAGHLWDGHGTPGVALTNVSKSADTSDGVCNPAGQACDTQPGGAGANTLGDIDSVTVAAPGGGVRSLVDIPVHSLTWSDSACSPAITPGCCPASTYNPADGDLVITEFDFILSPTTNDATGVFADKNGDGCFRAGSGFDNAAPGANGPKSLSGSPATGPCCTVGQPTTVVSVGAAFSGGAPLFDLGFKSTIPNTVSSCGSPGGDSCTVTTNSCLQ
jgi:hypothetical protein